ncbi:MAG TPA: ribonuclease P protein component [Xanthomonadaceae bacterium]|nr:ribonuclease P protein component [Xanthomonadaceae bacterium]
MIGCARYPRCARLTRRGDFDHAFKSGQRFHTRCFRVHYCDAPADTARLGITLSRKVARRAHDRNRMKRLVRETFRLARPGLPPLDLVLLAKPELKSAGEDALKADLDMLWQRVRTLKREGGDGTIRAGSTAPAHPGTPSP